jgi:hypothetical protein
MAEVIAESAGGQVVASDIFDYGYGQAPIDFLHDEPLARPEWIITNPPFNLACEFTLRVLDLASEGVAMLVRMCRYLGARPTDGPKTRVLLNQNRSSRSHHRPSRSVPDRRSCGFL